MAKIQRSSLLLLALTASLPAQAEWSTFFGKTGDDFLLAMTTDDLGRVYVCGHSDVANHVSSNTYQPAIRGGYDAFIACLDPRLPASQQVVWATHLGGSGDELACDLHVDASGTRVTVVGYTTSMDFPTLGAGQSQLGGGRDGFVAVFDPTAVGAAQLQWSCYLGGMADDVAVSVDDWGGLPTIAGTTESSDFPTHSASQPTLGGGRDLFVCRMVPGGSMLFSTYLGGSADDGGQFWASTVPFHPRTVQVVVNELGEVIVGSDTASIDFPNPTASTHGPRGLRDIVVSRLDPMGVLLYSTVIGGSADDVLHELRLDGASRVVITGNSGSSNFPVTANKLQGFQGGRRDGALVHLDTAQDQVRYATLFGGPNEDYAMDAYREPSGTFVVGGHSFSPQIPTAGAPQTQFTAARGQVFLARLRPDANSTALQYATWFSGNNNQTVLNIEPDGRGGVFAAGPTISTDFPTTANALDTTFDGFRDGWIAQHPMLPASAARFGRPSSPCGLAPFLQMTSAPLPGNGAFGIETHGAPASAFGALIIGVPLPAGSIILGAEVFVMAPVDSTPLVLSDAQGYMSQSLPLPANFVWSAGTAIQSVWLNPAACSGGVVTTSNALR